MNLENKNLRYKILDTIVKAKEGHIPSSFSIVDIINYIYTNKVKKNKNHFILSKGHGAMALYVVLEKFKLLKKKDLESYGKINSILGGHPDTTKIKNVETSTGSLGHGFLTGLGMALGYKIKNKNKDIYCLIGDGECHEGTIWEGANIGANNKLNNFFAIVDNNNSAKQLMPIDDLYKKWNAFGWNVEKCNGHSSNSINKAFNKINKLKNNKPNIIIAETIKGFGSKLIQHHGKWHHKLPDKYELDQIKWEILNEIN